MSFICVVIGLHVGKAGQVNMQRRIGGLDSVQFWRCTGMAWLSLRLVSGLTRAELPALAFIDAKTRRRTLQAATAVVTASRPGGILEEKLAFGRSSNIVSLKILSLQAWQKLSVILALLLGTSTDG